MGIKKRTTYTWESPDGEVLPIPWPFMDNTELFKMSDDGLACVLGSLTQEEDAQNPIEDWDNGELVIFDRGTYRPEIDAWKRLIRDNAGFIVPVTYRDYGSSGCHISCGQVLTAKDCRGDKRTGENSEAERVLDDMNGYYIIPNDVTNPQGYANSIMETTQQYYDGDIYGVCVWTYTRDFAEYDLNGVGVPGEFTPWSEPDRDRECWGFYGYDHAEKELKEQFESTDFPKPPQGENSRQGELIL